MNAAWQERLAHLLQNPDPYKLDHLITLAELLETGRAERELWSAAADLGGRWREKYWQSGLSTKENMLALGIRSVRVTGPMEDMMYRARALYDPNDCSVAVSEKQLDELEAAFAAAGSAPFTRDELWQRLLAHELFHHIEETREQPVSALLQGRFGESVPAQYRDVGAYAFVNACFGGIPCQVMDLLWMKAKAPQRLQELLENTEMFRTASGAEP